MDLTIYRYFEAVGCCVIPGVFALIKPDMMLDNMLAPSHLSPLKLEHSETSTYAMRMFGLTVLGFGNMLYVTYPAVPKKVKTQLLWLLLLGDAMHLSTVAVHANSLFGGYTSKQTLLQIIPSTFLAMTRLVVLFSQ